MMGEKDGRHPMGILSPGAYCASSHTEGQPKWADAHKQGFRLGYQE